MPNPVMRWQILTPNVDKAADFYTSLFGWEVSRDNLLRYAMVDTGSERGVPGGIWPAPPEAPSFVQLFVEVEDCGAYVAKAQTLGASTLMPPQSLPDGDVMAILKDPCGVSFGVFQPAG
jgi:predicted enzyme related to lactoylglutathione lyase